jgi:hypothetical protein
MGMLNVALDVSSPDALALLCGHAYATSRTVDEIAHHIANHRIAAETCGWVPTSNPSSGPLPAAHVSIQEEPCWWGAW